MDRKSLQMLNKVISMMKEFKLSQAEAMHKLNEELAFLRDMFIKTPCKGF